MYTFTRVWRLFQKLTLSAFVSICQGFFSKFLMGGDSKFSVPVGPRWGRSRMGGGDLRKKSDWSQNCPLNAKLAHFLLFWAWNTAFKCTFQLKSGQIWHKNVFKFFKFSGTNLGWGGDKPWSKNGDKCQMGGIGKIFAGWGGPPQSPPGKKPCMHVQCTV